ncbi:hypothetical protein [Nocardioides zeae]|uniref:Type I restriction modification DNA specificity domain-containing protein n=1 Tax=Nocardioides zeae TaxID=1457234 RepID=A0A6P0HEH1_9ACTN|nr:hypothetical protein [Nocardioides zeae]NEN76774.1 hypothetical protein [Nocardioides zeae]
MKTDGVSQSNINGTKLGDMPLPLPPIEEQRAIVARVGALLTVADELGERIDRASAVLERNAQAVLAKAFRGELSPAAEAPCRICNSLLCGYTCRDTLLDFAEVEGRGFQW